MVEVAKHNDGRLRLDPGVCTKFRGEGDSTLLVDRCFARRSSERTLSVAGRFTALDTSNQVTCFVFERVDAADADATVFAGKEVTQIAEGMSKGRRQCHSSSIIELSLVHPDKHRLRLFPAISPGMGLLLLVNEGVFPSAPPFWPH